MSLLLAPYNNAMRLGQGFNSYTQQICVDDAVVIDPDRAENVITNDGTTMRIMAQMSAKPSAWNRQKEVVSDERAKEALLRIETENHVKKTAVEQVPARSSSESSGNDLTIVERVAAQPNPTPPEPVVESDQKQPITTKPVVEADPKQSAVLADEAEQQRLREQRLLREQIEKENRDEERQRRYEDRVEQRKVRQEEREWQAQRREEARKAVADAAKEKAAALTLDDLTKIRAQNQFVERFGGMGDDKEKYVYDASADKGPSQTVTYSSKFIDRLSDITDDMSISGALSIKAARIGGSGRGSFVDSDKFKDSDLKFYISVKVINQTVNFKDALVYNAMRNIKGPDFNKVFGDSFISGFVEGGEFNALVTMKVLNKAKMTDIKAEAKVALTAGPVDITAEANVGIARSNLETNTETTIQVSWCGGGHVKPMEQPWNIESIMQAAARFPDLVAECPQRTYAILTKYESLRSFVALKPEAFTALQYENAQIYTNALMDAFMTYKSMYKKLGEQIVSIQAKTLELVPWDVGSETPSGVVTVATTAAAKSNDDTSRFEDSIKGLSDARTAMRKQMMYIVNEVDLIEGDPKKATNADHKEPFQSPASFEARIPEIKVPGRLQRSAQPLGGKRFIAKTQTEKEFKDQAEQDEKAESQPLFDSTAELTQSERDLLTQIQTENPTIGSSLRVSFAVGGTEKGEDFNNIEVLQPEWKVTTISLEVSRGAITYVEVEYDNGLLLRKGKAGSGDSKIRRLTDFQPGERVTSAALECGSVEGKTDGPRVTALRLYTNRGRRLLAQAANNEVVGDKVIKDGIVYEQLKTLYLDQPFPDGSFKGFFGCVDNENPASGLLRLGLVWGSVQFEKKATLTKPKPFDYEAPVDENAVQSVKTQLAARNRDYESLKRDTAGDQEKLKSTKAELDAANKEIDRLRGKVDAADAPKKVTNAQSGVVMPSGWDPSTATTPKFGQVTFKPAYQDIPRIITGLNLLEQPTSKEIAFTMEPNSLATTGFNVSFSGRAGGDMKAPRMSWLSLPENDVRFEAGILDTDGLVPVNEPAGTASVSLTTGFMVQSQIAINNRRLKNRHFFATPFKNEPRVLAWIVNMNLPGTAATGPWHSLRIGVEQKKPTFFDVSAFSWYDRMFNGVRIGWLAFDDYDKKGVVRFGQVYVDRTAGGSLKTENVTYSGFSKPPSVFVASRELDCDAKSALGLKADVSDITTTGFKVAFGNFGHKENMDHCEYIWIAIE